MILIFNTGSTSIKAKLYEIHNKQIINVSSFAVSSISSKKKSNFSKAVQKIVISNKLDKKNIKRTSLKNEFPKQISFKYSKGNDIFNQDYDSKYIQSFGSNLVHNDSDFSTEKKEVNLSISPTIFKTIKSKYSG